MKKISFLSFFFCLIILLDCLLVPVSATANLATVPPQTDPGAEATVSTAAEEYSFGTECIYQGCRTIEAGVPLGTTERLLDTAQAVVLFETNTNTMVYSYNPDMKLSSGTLVKIVTALVAIEQCDLDEVVTAHSQNISRLPAGSSNVNLKEGEELTVKDLLMCLLLQGANDAAIALAEHISGNMQGFLVLMNDRIMQMGCTHTEFANIHGLDNAVQYTTARDMAKIMMEAYKNETFVEISSTTEYTVPETNKSDPRAFRTTNYLMDEYIVPQFYTNKVKAGLASHTDNSGSSIACVAVDEAKKMQYVGVILGATRIFNKEKSWVVESYGNFNEMIDLLEYGFNSFKVNRIVYDGQALNQFSVIGGESQAVGQPHIDIDTVLPASCQMTNLEKRYKVTGGSLTAPVAKDELIATVSLWYRNSCVAEAELYAMSDVKSAEQTDVTIHSHISQAKAGSGGFNIIGTVCVVILGAVGIYLIVNDLRRRRAQARRRKRRANRRRSY